ncbi:hypothetical protein V6N13_004503 [Hibiscus sabdariffa]
MTLSSNSAVATTDGVASASIPDESDEHSFSKKRITPGQTPFVQPTASSNTSAHASVPNDDLCLLQVLSVDLLLLIGVLIATCLAPMQLHFLLHPFGLNQSLLIWLPMQNVTQNRHLVPQR